MSVLYEIAAERRRQIEAEGWTPEHDDEHDDGEMFVAAQCYFNGDLTDWPWEQQRWKPKDIRRNLVRAGALVQADIERILRKSRRTTDYYDAVRRARLWRRPHPARPNGPMWGSGVDLIVVYRRREKLLEQIVAEIERLDRATGRACVTCDTAGRCTHACEAEREGGAS